MRSKDQLAVIAYLDENRTATHKIPGLGEQTQ